MNQIINRRVSFWIVNLLIASTFTVGAQASQTFQYPELVVTPRASERLQMEAEHESRGRWTAHLPIQISALTTLASSFMVGADSVYQARDPGGYARLAGAVVGAGWIAGTVALSALYQPNQSAHSEIQALPGKTERERLVRERMAEEAIESQAKLGRRLMWLSVLTNAGASGYMVMKSNPMSFAGISAIGATVASFAPVVFQYRWQQVAREQRKYKKRIYGPIAQGGWILDPQGSLSPGMTVTLRF